MSIKHLAIIMDGNRRWAVSNGLTIFDGYKKGVEIAKKVVDLAIQKKILHLTLFALSIENWKRAQSETNYLQALMQSYLESYAKNYHDYGVKFTVVGEKKRLSLKLQQVIKEVELLTINNSILNLYIAFSYSGRSEIMDACKKMISANVNTEDITEQEFRKYLYSPTMPDIDLLIRTSGEQRISNFLLWHLVYSELYFVSKYWPDFDEVDFNMALEDYLRRKRTFGLSKKQIKNEY
ncbi:di-trans,poly-cis-decaprenylcistransferase [Orientia chuto str. Dubai]|uniref:Isoprenyl transferase n=1 Tax=Orientia chuto str. Dubai TaxID=1359168 RepID=A0A0F3MID4_9RICK|nr:polyprenyl diphosphate synthase [Candidatus Orientia mediorientalis]KJV55515.1 di-trans,poly-cis-decaprenylcistransferase [Orientia chuto str. Dubai]